MKKLVLLISAAAIVGFGGSAFADPIDCTNLIGAPKNLGQLNKVVRETPILSGQNVPKDARLFGEPVDDWIKEQVFSACTNGVADNAQNTVHPD